MTQYEIKQIHGKFDKNESKFGKPSNSMTPQPVQQADTVNGPSASGPHPVGPNKPKFHAIQKTGGTNK